jgi:hypothetical protein
MIGSRLFLKIGRNPSLFHKYSTVSMELVDSFSQLAKKVDSGTFQLFILNTGSGQVQGLPLATWKTGAAPTASASDPGAMLAAYLSSFCTLTDQEHT